MKRAGLIVLIFALGLLCLWMLTRAPDQHLGSYADARFLWRADYSSQPYDPVRQQQQMQAMSNILLYPGGVKALAEAAQIPETEFKFVGFFFIRNTSLICIRYAGSDPNTAQRVASNAYVMLEKLYLTNQPTLELRLVDTGPYVPRTFWRELRDEIDYRLHR